jgi:two-component system phosphate regulon sensor histidine kinase PhoR
VQGLRALRTRFLWKLFGAYAAAVFAALAWLALAADARLERALVDQLAEGLEQTASALEPLALRAAQHAPSSDTTSPELPASLAGGVTVQLVRTGATDAAPELALFADDEELAAALSAPFGRAMRRDRGPGEKALHVARAIRAGRSSASEGELVAVLRLSSPLDSVEARMAAVRAKVAIGAAAALLLGLAAGFALSVRISAPVAEMNIVAASLRAGDAGARVAHLPADELGDLGFALNRLGDELARRIATISADDAQLRAMLAGMVEGVVAVDDLDRVVFANGAARRLLGLDSVPVEERPLGKLVRLGGLDRLLDEARAGRAASREVTVPNGAAERALQIHANAFRSGERSGLVLVLHDITDLRRLERIRRDFVANVSHELKTPLTSIRGYVETLLDGGLREPETAERFLRKVSAQAERLSHLVTDLLSLARIESQAEGLELADVDWAELLEDVVRRHEARIREKGLFCRLEVVQRPLVVRGEPESIVQVVDNLLDNAVKYTPAPGEVRVRLARDGARARLEVEDTGIGIPEQDLGRIFERFYRVDKARSRELGGTGLGLAIVKHLAQAMGGEVGVRSELGRGSCFTVWLPLARGA